MSHAAAPPHSDATRGGPGGPPPGKRILRAMSADSVGSEEALAAAENVRQRLGRWGPGEVFTGRSPLVKVFNIR